MSRKKLFDDVWSDGRFLDTNNVGSSVRWKVTANVTLVTPKEGAPYTDPDVNAELAMSDCTRIITWSGYDHTQASMLSKVRGAIQELQACERALVRAVKQAAKYNKRPKVEDEE